MGPFRNLLEGMLAFKAEDRFSVEQIMEHEWFNGPVPTDEEVFAEFSARLGKVKEEQEREREEKILLEKRKATKKSQGMGYSGQTAFRDLDAGVLRQFALEEAHKTLVEKFPDFENKDRTVEQHTDTGMVSQTQRFLRMDMEDLLEFLLCVLQKNDKVTDLKLAKGVYELECNFKTDFLPVGLKMNIQRVDEEVCVLNFTKTNGALMSFYDQVKMIKKDYLTPLTEVYQKKQQE